MAGGVPRHCHGHQRHAVGGGNEPRRGIPGPGAMEGLARLLVPSRTSETAWFVWDVCGCRGSWLQLLSPCLVRWCTCGPRIARCATLCPATQLALPFLWLALLLGGAGLPAAFGAFGAFEVPLPSRSHRPNRACKGAPCFHRCTGATFPHRCTGAPFLPPQVVELDFQYPSEGIHKRWDGGYRITALAATPDQVCGS